MLSVRVKKEMGRMSFLSAFPLAYCATVLEIFVALGPSEFESNPLCLPLCL